MSQTPPPRTPFGGSSPAGPGIGGGAPTRAPIGPAIPGSGGARYPQLPQPTAKARKVRGGLKLSTKSGPVSMAWAGQRLMRLVEELASGEALTEGVEYARAGQTRVLTINPGHVHARVQGRMPQAYSVDVRVPVFTFAQWDEAIGAMAAEARPLAALLSGEVPPNIEDFFSPFRLHLFPSDAAHLSVSCSCAKAWAAYVPPPAPAGATTGPAQVIAPPPLDSPWCKHVCCVMALLAERLGQDAFLMTSLRGLGKDDLLERLRQRRAISTPRSAGSGGAGGVTGSAPAASADGGLSHGGASDRPVPVFTARIPGVTDVPSTPLDQGLELFWTAGEGLESIDLTIDAPEVTHALLRRLGPTPFPSPPAKFPLIGLLSTCYSVISERAIAEASGAPAAPDESPLASDEGAP